MNRAQDCGPPLPAAIAGLLYSLPPEDQFWPPAHRAAFLDALAKMIDLVYTYPAPPPDPAPGSYEPGTAPAAHSTASADDNG